VDRLGFQRPQVAELIGARLERGCRRTHRYLVILVRVTIFMNIASMKLNERRVNGLSMAGERKARGDGCRATEGGVLGATVAHSAA
jgi:hypothetical protein